MPDYRSQEGGRIKKILHEIGIFREGGLEHFCGCLTLPIFSGEGKITGMYGRRVAENRRLSPHLYLPGPHQGILNPDCLKCKEIVLCEAILDGLSLWLIGAKNVTSSYGTNGLTRDHLSLFKSAGVEKVYLAYDGDQAGREGARLGAQRLALQGIESLRIDFPEGLDANDFLVKLGSKAGTEFAKLMSEAKKVSTGNIFLIPAEIQNGQQNPKDAGEEEKTAACPLDPQPPGPLHPVNPPNPADSSNPAERSRLLLPMKKIGEDWETVLEDRTYRIRGMKKNLAYDTLRVHLRVMRGDKFFMDQIELYQARQRTGFIHQASQEIGVSEEVVKSDLGRILLALEELQDRQIKGILQIEKPQEKMSEKEREEALGFLRDKNLVPRIVEDFHSCGLVGEDTNCLVGYLAALSRKLEDPLALIIQSLSAAGKSALMDAVLAFVPEGDVSRYSSVSGQSLFYMEDGNLKHKILAISELEGAERAVYSIKILQSEKSLKIASTGRDPKTGKLITHIYLVDGPVQILFCTTDNEVDEELLTRCLLIVYFSLRSKRLQVSLISLRSKRY